MGYMEIKCSGSGERREEGLGKGLAAVLYTIWFQTDCWNCNDVGGRNNNVCSLPDAETVLNRESNALLKQADLDLDCVTLVEPPGQADPKGFDEE